MWVVASKTRVRHKRNRNISRNLVGAEEEKEGVAGGWQWHIMGLGQRKRQRQRL